MKAISIFLLFIGMFLVVQGYYKQVQGECPKPEVQIKYIPRSLYDEQLSDDPKQMVSQQYKGMFDDINTWPGLAASTTMKDIPIGTAINNSIKPIIPSGGTTGFTSKKKNGT
jgi:hypothetical protein